PPQQQPQQQQQQAPGTVPSNQPPPPAGATGAAGPAAAAPPQPPQQQQQQPQPQIPRFEDLTVDDDLPLLPRIRRYVRSGIALQRLVHVRMLGEASIESGRRSTATELVPLLPPLVRDGESIIRQRLCGELRTMCLVLMGMTGGGPSDEAAEAPGSPMSGPSDPDRSRRRRPSRRGGGGGGTKDEPPRLPRMPLPDRSSKYYAVMVHHVFPHLATLASDPDGEVRRAASEGIVKLALRVDPDDVPALCLSVPLRLVKEGQRRASAAGQNGAGGGKPDRPDDGDPANNPPQPHPPNPQTPAEDLLITASNLLADLASFLPPPRLPPDVAARYLSPAVLGLAEDPNFRVRRAAVQALPRTMGSAGLDDVRRRLLPRFVALSGDEMYRVRKASGECLVDVSRALGVLPWRVHFGEVWRGREDRNDEDEDEGGYLARFYRRRTPRQVSDLHDAVRECHEIRRRALCAVAKKLLEDPNKFVRYGMMQFLGPLIASFYPLDRGAMVGAMGGLTYPPTGGDEDEGEENGTGDDVGMGTLAMGAEGVAVAKASTGLPRVFDGLRYARSDDDGGGGRAEDLLSYNHALHGLELVLHGESPLIAPALRHGGGARADRDPFGTMGAQFFPHANGMVGRSGALDDDDTDGRLVRARRGLPEHGGRVGPKTEESPRDALPKFLLEGRSDALALARIARHREGRVPVARPPPSDDGDEEAPRDGAGEGDDRSIALPYPPSMTGRPDPEDLRSVRSALLGPFVAMARCRTGEDTTDAEMRVYCAYSLPAAILLFGGRNWESDGLRQCFLDLLSGGSGEPPDGGGSGGSGERSVPSTPPGPPLPVKRCLASSVHAVAHLLGPALASSDPAFLAAFERSFLRDTDDAIRLNVIKNLASWLGALPPGPGPGHRDGFLPALEKLTTGDDGILSAVGKRSASNPGVLNWRQRDSLAKSLPDLMVLFDAAACREYFWPVLRTLLTDSVSAVREDAGWSVPVLLRRYVAEANSRRHPDNAEDDDADEAAPFSWVSEVTAWLRETFLDEGGGRTNASAPSPRVSSRKLRKKQTTMSEGAFSKRQGYCRIMATVALAMRMGEDDEESSDGFSWNPNPSERLPASSIPPVPVDPFGPMSPRERDRFRSLMLGDMLPPALDMASDCVANVRLTLTKCLKVLPADIRRGSRVEEVLATLEEELMTWDVGDMPLSDANPGGILGNGISSSMVGVPASSSDPPEAKVGGDNSGSLVMTSTMSAC
ncbi:hypothetical protein ACHAWF_010099, partial [Thalassiosira exigua]